MNIKICLLILLAVTLVTCRKHKKGKHHHKKGLVENKSGGAKNATADARFFFGGPSFDSFNKYNEIYKMVRDLAKKHPGSSDSFQLSERTNAYDIRIYGIRINKAARSSSREKRIPIILTGGMVARDWLASATLLNFAKEMLEPSEPEMKKKILKVLNKHDLFIMPLVNPEGYSHSQKTDRDWVKNRATVGQQCRGVNLNRNFKTNWQKNGKGVKDPCSENYAGSSLNSETETANIARYLNLADFYPSASKPKAYWNVNSGGPEIAYPYGYTESSMYYEDYTKAPAEVFANAASIRYGTDFKVIKLSDKVLAGGQAIDFARAEIGIYYAFDIFLRRRKGRGQADKPYINDESDIKESTMEFCDGFLDAVEAMEG